MTPQDSKGFAPLVVTIASTSRAVREAAPNTPAANNSPNDHARIVNPRSGATLRGTVAYTGAADIADLSYYKLEAGPENTTEWRAVFRRGAPVNGELMQWDSTTTAAGRYQVRLVVVDRTDHFPEPCVISVTVG